MIGRKKLKGASHNIPVLSALGSMSHIDMIRKNKQKN
jgi:hypothetical protein